MSLKKSTIKRLQGMLKQLEARENAWQLHYGDVVKGTQRASLLRDAQALRDVLANVPAPIPRAPAHLTEEKA